MATLTEPRVLEAFERVRRAQNDGRYAPHKPLLLLLALARVQRGEPRLVTFSSVEPQLKALLTEFGPTRSADRRHLPFWHLHTDQRGRLWDLDGPANLLDRPAGATPTLGELRQPSVRAGFAPGIQRALEHTPGLLQQVGRRVLDAFFPETLHADILAATGLDLDVLHSAADAAPPPFDPLAKRAARDPAFREKVLLAYEYRCCVCGFDLRLGHLPAGLEAAHIQWHHVGGPDIAPNGLALCALHHKLFDLGAFTIEPGELRVVFSQHAIAADRGTGGGPAHHGQPIRYPQEDTARPHPRFLEWNRNNVFKRPERGWR